MAEMWSGHFDSTPEDKRVLLAETWAKYIRSFVSDGIRNGGSCLQITQKSGMTVRMDEGVATIQGYIFRSDSDRNGAYYDITLPPPNPSNPRIDRIVLRLDRTIPVRLIMPEVLQGDAGKNPVPRALTRNENIWELSLAQIRVSPQAAGLSAADITDERFNESVCGLMNSVLGLDSSVWRKQFDDFMAHILAQENDFLAAHEGKFNTQLTTQETRWKTQTARQESDWQAQQRVWETWLARIGVDIQIIATFDFDNIAALPGTRRATVFVGNAITMTIRIKGSGVAVAERKTTFNSDGTITTAETVFGPDGAEIVRKSTVTTAFEGDGSITNEVSGVYEYPAAVTVSASLEEHKTDENVHQNIIIDGND